MAKKRESKQARLAQVARVEIGKSPGSLSAPPGASPPTASFLSYGPDGMDEGALTDLTRIRELRERYPVTWINVDGLGDVAFLEALGETFGLHTLALEDVLNIPQRPKMESYPEALFLVFRMPVASGRFDSEQVSVFVGEDFVLSIQERTGDVFDPVRRRIREERPRIRNAGPDYLAYTLLDIVVDSHFPLLEEYGTRLVELEERVLSDPMDARAHDLHDLKRDLTRLARSVWPLREVNIGLARGDEPLVTEATQLFLRDAADHTHHVLDLIESYRDAATGLMDLHLSLMSQRMNEVMKVLTVIATIFIPLSFIAGVYGMNFDPDISGWNMPELRWRWGYPFVLGLMAALAGSMLLFFRRRGWFR